MTLPYEEAEICGTMPQALQQAITHISALTETNPNGWDRFEVIGTFVCGYTYTVSYGFDWGEAALWHNSKFQFDVLCDESESSESGGWIFDPKSVGCLTSHGGTLPMDLS